MSNILPVGNEIYQETHNGMYIQGISYTEDELNQSAQIVADICFDTLGLNDFENYMSSLSSTKFSDTGVRSVNAVLPTVRDWQVGEGFAEAYLTAHFSCFFPWSSNRDRKNLDASLPGADIVGFYQGKFAFGEVKTSAEQKYPPQVTSKKRDGLNAQLEKLCHDYDIRWVLVQHLYHRMINTKDEKKHQEASMVYMHNNNNFYIFGVLVRDVEPKINDWDYLKKHFKVHEQNRVSLLALYLPQNDGIQKLHDRVLSKGAKS